MYLYKYSDKHLYNLILTIALLIVRYEGKSQTRAGKERKGEKRF